MRDKTLLPSRLIHRLTLQSMSTVADGAGGYSTTWVDVAQIWGEIIPQRAEESVVSGKITEISKAKIKVRYRSDITAEKRFLYEGRVFSIAGIVNKPTGKRDFLEISVIEGVES